MKDKSGIRFKVLALVVFFGSMSSSAVTSKIVRQNTQADFAAGEVENVIIGSKGRIELGRAWEKVIDKLEDDWTINSVVTAGGAIYIGTSPNGSIYKYSLGELTKIYPVDEGAVEEVPSDEGEIEADDVEDESGDDDEADGGDVEDESSEADGGDVVEDEKRLSNNHVFAMAIESSGRLLAGISGDECKLLRFKADEAEIIFEPEEAKYIFAITLDQFGSIYLGTGPEGSVYKLGALGENGKLIYQATDKNILSLAVGSGGEVYAGSDGRGVVYKIDSGSESASVLYDSDEEEITALLVTNSGAVYAAGTHAQISPVPQEKPAPKPSPAGRPEAAEKQEGDSQEQGGTKLMVANTNDKGKGAGQKQQGGPAGPPPSPPPPPGQLSRVYKISKDGFVTKVFERQAVLLTMSAEGDDILIGTGNEGELISINPKTEEVAVVYADEESSQITAVAIDEGGVVLGLSNHARLVRVKSSFAKEGSFSSDLIDAGQPARWGRLQIDADIPQGCQVLMSARSGNVNDVNDPTFSAWTEPVAVDGPVEIGCPVGRFCQYKLILKSEDGKATAVVREVAAANVVDNLSPRMESVNVDRIAEKGKDGIFKISYKAADDNSDKLVYKIDFRMVGRIGWIELEDEHDKAEIEWDSRTVEDGRYEIRVVASDEKSNTTATKMTAARISEQVVVDNTAPAIVSHVVSREGSEILLKLTVADEFSTIGSVGYTVDSNTDWKGVLPNDMVFDTTDEAFTITIEDVEEGEHVVALKIADDIGNTMYKSVLVE